MLQIKKGKDDSYRFRFLSENGRALLTSVPFAEKEDAERAMEYLKTSRELQNVFERKTNHNGQFLFSIKDARGNLVAHSGPYNSEAGMENGIKSLKNRIGNLS